MKILAQNKRQIVEFNNASFYKGCEGEKYLLMINDENSGVYENLTEAEATLEFIIKDFEHDVKVCRLPEKGWTKGEGNERI